jgi:hypothetical protein
MDNSKSEKTKGAPRSKSGAGAAFKSRKGSSAVFLTMILSALLLLVGVLIQAAGLAAGKSYGDLVFQMAGRSLLSEYDKKLYEDYGLFAMRSDEEQAARKLLYYSDASLKNGGRAGTVWLLPCKTGELSVHLSDFSLLDADTFEDQILDDIKFIMLNNLADRLRAAPAETGAAAAADGGESRTINNQVVLGSLPSKGLGGGPSVVDMLAAGLPSSADLLNGGTDAFLVSEYIMARFAHAYAPAPNLAAGHTRFFENETEYIINGEYSDAKNLEGVENRLRLLRFALNEVFVHSDSDMRAKVDTLVSILTAIFPEIPAPIFRELINAVWVAVETENDLKLLRAEEKVALVKKKDNWAISIDAVPGFVLAYLFGSAEPGSSADIKDVAGSTARGWAVVKPRDKDGFSYGNYLRLLLFFTSRENKLLRSMDLIQINMKTGYYEAFLLREHYVGLRYELVMNGDTYRYRQSYDQPVKAT